MCHVDVVVSDGFNKGKPLRKMETLGFNRVPVQVGKGLVALCALCSSPSLDGNKAFTLNPERPWHAGNRFLYAKRATDFPARADAAASKAALGRVFPVGCHGAAPGPADRRVVAADQCRPTLYHFSTHVSELNQRNVPIDQDLERTMRAGDARATFAAGTYYQAIQPRNLWRPGWPPGTRRTR